MNILTSSSSFCVVVVVITVVANPDVVVVSLLGVVVDKVVDSVESDVADSVVRNGVVVVFTQAELLNDRGRTVIITFLSFASNFINFTPIGELFAVNVTTLKIKDLGRVISKTYPISRYKVTKSSAGIVSLKLSRLLNSLMSLSKKIQDLATIKAIQKSDDYFIIRILFVQLTAFHIYLHILHCILKK